MQQCGVTKLTIFLLWLERYIFSIKLISALCQLTYKNIGKIANKSINIPNHLTDFSPTWALVCGYLRIYSFFSLS